MRPCTRTGAPRSIVAALGAGTLSTILVAVIAAAVPPKLIGWGGSGMRQYEDEVWEFDVNRWPGVTHVLVSRIESPFVHGIEPPYWSALAYQDRPRMLSDDRRGLNDWKHEMAAGWPLRALRGELVNSSIRLDNSTPAESRSLIRVGPEKVIPFRPLILGFAGDLVLYSTAWASLLFAPGWIRSAARRRRGACVQCGYELSGITGPCPECGGDREQHP